MIFNYKNKLYVFSDATKNRVFNVMLPSILKNRVFDVMFPSTVILKKPSFQRDVSINIKKTSLQQ